VEAAEEAPGSSLLSPPPLMMMMTMTLMLMPMPML
jgi:hypothetical protein